MKVVEDTKSALAESESNTLHVASLAAETDAKLTAVREHNDRILTTMDGLSR